MILNTIFTEGWEWQVLLFGSVFLLARHSVYTIIFRPLAGGPRSGSYEDIVYWYRSTSFFGAVVFAPVFEEVIFTFLAYKAFLGYAQPGQEGIVMLFVAGFFALLHLPGDLNHMAIRLGGIDVFLLIKFQLNRFFYSLGAFFLYTMTGLLWVTIGIHAIYNALISFNRLDLEDRPETFEKGDGRLRLTMFINLTFAILASILFYQYDPQTGWWLLPGTAFLLMYDFLALSR